MMNAIRRRAEDVLHSHVVAWLFAALVIVPIGRAQDAAHPAPFKKEEIERLVAPIALYPDALPYARKIAEVLPGDPGVKRLMAELEGSR